MKKLHQDNLYCWSSFDESRNIDFHSFLWLRKDGNIAFDPQVLSAHDAKHLESLGGVKTIIVSNSDHIRDAENLSALTGAKIYGPEAEKANFELACDGWLAGGETLFDDLQIFSLAGSKTPGELAFVIEENTLLTADLIRAHAGGSLCLLPDPKLTDKTLAHASVKSLVNNINVDAVLVCDGWPVFRDGQRILEELISTI